MKKIKNLMNEQIDWMFTHNGEKNEEISNRLSVMIDEYCKSDLDDDDALDKIAEVGEVWKDLVLARYNFVLNEVIK